MKRLKFTLSKATLEKLYLILIQPILEYGSVIFDACTQADCQLIESVQYDAVRICTGAIWYTNRTTMLNEMGWETLETRRKLSKMTFFVQDEKIILYLHTYHVFLHLCFPDFTALP